jgi:signal transduction histidine kinase
MRPFRGWSVKAKSIALLVGYAFFLAAVYGGFSTFLLQRETAAAHDRLQQTAQLVSAEIDAQVDAGRRRLATVAQLPGLVHGLRRLEEAPTEGYIPPWTTLHYLFFKSPLFTGGVFLLDRAGTVLWTEPPGLPWLGRSFAADPRIAAMYRGGSAPSPGIPADDLLASPHVLMGAPIKGPDGAVAGLLCGVVDLATAGFSTSLLAASTTEGGHLAVVDQEGRVISSTNPAQLLKSTASVSRAGEPTSLASAPLRRAPWHVVAGEPLERALAPIRELQRILLGLGAVMLLVAIAVGSRFLRSFVDPIERLTHSAEVMASGDLSQPVANDDWHRELATLGRTFERMRTELRRSQAALTRRLAEREELIRLKEEFLANVSHELRTPLNVIFGYTDMLREGENDGERRAVLDRIRSQSEQLLELVRDLMTLSGVSAGKISLEISPVDPSDAVGRQKPLMQQLARGRPVTFECECGRALPPLHTDPLRLEQVLINLVTNAFKFTLEGRVVLRVAHDVATRRIRFEVADTGIGIPARELPFIFDEFRQVDGSMSRDHGGMGLGLALVRRLVDLLGGEVTVTSRPGAGSTFTVALPLEHPAAGSHAGRAESPPSPPLAGSPAAAVPATDPEAAGRTRPRLGRKRRTRSEPRRGA